MVKFVSKSDQPLFRYVSYLSNYWSDVDKICTIVFPVVDLVGVAAISNQNLKKNCTTWSTLTWLITAISKTSKVDPSEVVDPDLVLIIMGVFSHIEPTKTFGEALK